MNQLNIRTSKTTEFIDVTAQVQSMVDANGVKQGVCYVYVPHTTAAITINEHADPTVVEDITTALEKMVPASNNYLHAEGNSAAHVKASLFGSNQTVIIEDGKLALGTWQGIFFCEFDGPRNRQVLVKVVSD